MADRDVNEAYFPTSVWAGISPTRPNPTAVHRSPDAEDWEQAILEVGAVQQLVADVVGDAIQTVTNGEATDGLIPGHAVVMSAAAEVDRATNDGTVAAASVIGLSLDTIAAAATGQIQTSGLVDLTTAQWDSATGGTGGLTVGAWYFVGLNGLLTATEPSSGDIIAPVGQAQSATQMLLRISYPAASAP